MTVELTDGYQTLITFANNPSVKFREISVKPPGASGGGAIPVSTMHNNRVRTQAPKALADITDATATVAYDPDAMGDILDMLQDNQLITVTYPDGSTYAFWGWLEEFEPSEHTEGERPTAEITIIASNRNDSGVETLPVETPGA